MDFTLNLLPRPNHRQATDNYFHQIGCYDNTSQKRHSNEGFNSRRRLKRRGNSPKVFPYKVRVTEDKVAEDLFHLQISRPSNYQRRQRTLSEIENSLTLDSDSDDDCSEKNGQVKLAGQFQEEFDKFKRMLMESNLQSGSLLPKPEVSKALVLWKPLPYPLKSCSEDEEKTETESPDSKAEMEVQFETDPASKNAANTKSESVATPAISSYLSDFNQCDDLMEL